MTLRYLTMAESRTGERGSQPEFEAFYLRTARLLHGYLLSFVPGSRHF